MRTILVHINLSVLDDDPMQASDAAAELCSSVRSMWPGMDAFVSAEEV